MVAEGVVNVGVVGCRPTYVQDTQGAAHLDAASEDRQRQVRTFVQTLAEEAAKDGVAVVIVSGDADGVDRWAQDEAARCGLGVVLFKPEYGRYGRAAPLKRNQQIVDASTRMVAFWDGRSSGTADSIKRARKASVPLVVLYLDREMEQYP